MPLQSVVDSPRPGRALLLAVLMAVVAAGFALGAGATGGETDLVADGAEADSAARRALAVASSSRPIAGPSTSDPESEAEVAAADVEPIRPRYESGVGALEGLAPMRPRQGVLSAAPDPAPTTTAAPPPTAPPTTPTPTTAPSTAPPAEAPTEPTEAPAPAEPAEGGETTTTAPPAHPEGFVDAGHGIFVPPVLLKIRFCESTDNYQAANPASSARGAYQFLTGSWAAYGHADRYGVSQAHLASPAQQDEAALITWQRDGTRPWNASRHCWG